MSIWVRCRGGALYLNPRFVRPWGYVIFEAGEPPELVLWIPVEGRTAPMVLPGVALAGLFGPDGFSFIEGDQPRDARRRVLGSDPPVDQMAIGCYFNLRRRITRPSGWDNCQRRMRGAIALEVDAHPRDAYEIVAPDSIPT